MRIEYLLVALLIVGLILYGALEMSGIIKNDAPVINNTHIEDVFLEKINGNKTGNTTKDKIGFIVLNNFSASESKGEGGESESKGCSGEYIEGMQGDYYIKGKVLDVETIPSADGTENYTYTYTTVDEYDKKNDSMPDLNPGNLVVINPVDSSGGAQNPEEDKFIYLYLEKTSDGYSMGC